MQFTSQDQTQNTFDYAVVIGRFQPVHYGHVAMLQAALQHAKQLIIIVGSVDLPRSIKNPFSFAERQQLLLQALPDCAQARVHIVPVADYNDDTAWVAAVQHAVHQIIHKQHMPVSSAAITLVGHEKDSSSYYLQLFSSWHFHAVTNVGGINATSIRNSYFTQPQSNQALWQNPNILPASTLAFLQQFMQTDAYQQLCFQN